MNCAHWLQGFAGEFGLNVGISSKKKKKKGSAVNDPAPVKDHYLRHACLVPVQTLKPGPASALCTKHFAACHPLSLPLFGCTFKWRLNLFLKTNLKLVSLICLYFIHLSNHHLISMSLLRCDNNRRYVGCLIRKQRLHFKLKSAAGEMERFLNEVLDANLQMLMTWIYLMTGTLHSSDDLWWGYFCIGAERLMKWITGRDYGLKSLM